MSLRQGGHSLIGGGLDGISLIELVLYSSSSTSIAGDFMILDLVWSYII
jgi:hypothetical protein